MSTLASVHERFRDLIAQPKDTVATLPAEEDSDRQRPWHTDSSWFLGSDLSRLTHYVFSFFMTLCILFHLLVYDAYAKAGAPQNHSSNRLLDIGLLDNNPMAPEFHSQLVKFIYGNKWAMPEIKRETIDMITLPTTGGSYWKILAAISAVYLCMYHTRHSWLGTYPAIITALQKVPGFKPNKDNKKQDFAAECRRMVFETTIRWASTIMLSTVAFGIGVIFLIMLHGKWSQPNALAIVDIDYVFTEAMRLSVPVLFVVVMVIVVPTPLRRYVIPWLDTAFFLVALGHFINLRWTMERPVDLTREGPAQHAIVAFHANACRTRQAGTSIDALLSTAGLMTIATYVTPYVAAMGAFYRLNDMVTAPKDVNFCHPILSTVDMDDVIVRIRIFNAEWHLSFVCCAIFLVLSVQTTMMKFKLKVDLGNILKAHRNNRLQPNNIIPFNDMLKTTFNMKVLCDLYNEAYFTKRDLVRLVTAWLVMGCLAFQGHLLAGHISMLGIVSAMLLILLCSLVWMAAYNKFVPNVLKNACSSTTAALTAGVGMIKAIGGNDKVDETKNGGTKKNGRTSHS